MVQNAVFSFLSFRLLYSYVSFCSSGMAVGCDFTKASEDESEKGKIPLISKMDRRTDELVFSDIYLWDGERTEQLYGADVWRSPDAEIVISFDDDSRHPYGWNALEPAFSLGKEVLDCLWADSLHLGLFCFVCLYLVSQLLASLWI